MKKLIDLRTHLTNSVPSLKKDPERLDVYIEKGGIACRYGNLCYQYAYEARILVKDFTDHADTLMVPLLAWVAIHQPDLLLDVGKQDNAIRFEAEIVDHDKTDVLLMLDLSERVIVSEIDGVYTATHCDEPALPDLTGPTPWALHVHGVEVVP